MNMRPSHKKPSISDTYSIQGAKKSLLNEDELYASADLTVDTIHTNGTISKPQNQYHTSTGWCAQWKQLSYNIKLILIYTFLWGAAISIWNRQLLAAYIFEISGDSTEALGFIEAIQGLAYLIAAIVSGIITDGSSSRISIIRFSGTIGLIIAVPVGVFTLLYVNKKYHDPNADVLYSILYKGIYYVWLFSYGICSSFCNTIISTVLTDLLPKGGRDFIFSFQWFIRRMASTLGPFIIVGMFYFLGNDWKISEMNIVLLSGLGLWVIPLLMLMFAFDTTELRVTTEINDQKEIDVKLKIDIVSNDTEHKYSRFIKWILLVHRLMVAFGAGMTVKFFPVFFEDEIGLKPISLNSIYIATPLTMAIFTILVERFSKIVGRPVAIITAKIVGVGSLVVMALLTSDLTAYADIIVVVAFAVRTGAQNCAYPLEKAILMDYVAKKNRGKWNAFESINSTVWTLSAALGGVLIGSIGYRDIYLTTASIYFVGVLELLPLYFITK